jgi:pSer/pThr/pTyr-binding forkhead associated (FHA) protein
MLTDRWSTSEKVSENGDYVVVDTSSLNGTYVNRKPVESVPPATATRFRWASCRLLFRTRPTTH